MTIVRPRAASSLDSLARVYNSALVLPVLLPVFRERIVSPDVWVRESALLALGAIWSGCDDLGALHPHLPWLIPVVLAQASERARVPASSVSKPVRCRYDFPSQTPSAVNVTRGNGRISACCGCSRGTR